MQMIIDNYDRNHFGESGYKQFLEEFEHFMQSWGLSKNRVTMIDGFNNSTKLTFINSEALLHKKDKSLLELAKNPWDDDEMEDDEDE